MTQLSANLSINMLRALVSLCRHQNTMKAAQELNVSQSAVSKYIQRLNEFTGEELFIRAHKGIEPTKTCLELRDKALDILELCESMSYRHRQAFDPHSADRQFKVAVPLLKSLFFLEMLCLKPMRQIPRVQINLVNLERSEALEALENGDLDLYLGLMPENLPKRFQTTEIARFDFGVICSNKSPLFNSGKITKREFVNTPHVTARAELVLEGKLKKLGILQNKLVYVPDKETAKRMLLETDYLFIADQQDASYFCQGSKDLKLLVANFELPAANIYQIWDRRNNTDPAHIWLRKYIEKSVPVPE